MGTVQELILSDTFDVDWIIIDHTFDFTLCSLLLNTLICHIKGSLSLQATVVAADGVDDFICLSECCNVHWVNTSVYGVSSQQQEHHPVFYLGQMRL